MITCRRLTAGEIDRSLFAGFVRRQARSADKALKKRLLIVQFVCFGTENFCMEGIFYKLVHKNRKV